MATTCANRLVSRMDNQSWWWRMPMISISPPGILWMCAGIVILACFPDLCVDPFSPHLVLLPCHGSGKLFYLSKLLLTGSLTNASKRAARLGKSGAVSAVISFSTRRVRTCPPEPIETRFKQLRAPSRAVKAGMSSSISSNVRTALRKSPAASIQMLSAPSCAEVPRTNCVLLTTNITTHGRMVSMKYRPLSVPSQGHYQPGSRCKRTNAGRGTDGNNRP
ncbi:hypothetical protein QBC40DRAFT_81642 [Triangularia verruculosa]|uniref:Uncharacterized protein n=1 Tax=Triangularia verruculosa TaxID=2587418 RepID=A0AAN6XFB1_9PEZI|nr:hypothetical protein QBC40DRAFT_81642 [Triangularia verruculosa]